MELGQDINTITHEEQITIEQPIQTVQTQTEPKRRGRPPKERVEPPPKPPRPPRKERPIKMRKPLATEDPRYANKYYHAHLAFQIRCPYCDFELIYQQLARHKREAQKCRVEQQEHVINKMQERLQTFESNQEQIQTEEQIQEQHTDT